MESKSAIKTLMQRANTLVTSVGGYWPALGATARCLEEYGELWRAINDGNDLEQIDEIVDVAIISSCIANQYCAAPSQDGIILGQRRHQDIITWNNEKYMSKLAESLGNLARVALCFEGIKPLKVGEKLPNLNDVYIDIFLIASSFARNRHNVNLIDRVSEIVSSKAARDSARFEIRNDPITSKVLQAFEAIRLHTLCPFAHSATFWGAPVPVLEESFQKNIASAVPDLIRFTNICRHHAIDGYVLQIPLLPKLSKLETLAEAFHATLRILNKLDPNSDGHLFSKVELPSWQFTFNKLPLFIVVLSDLYERQSSRFTFGVSGNYVLFQPDISFDRVWNSRHELKEDVRQRIRELFAENGQEYRGKIIADALL